MYRLIALLSIVFSLAGTATSQVVLPDGSIQGYATEGAMGITETVDQIMERARNTKDVSGQDTKIDLDQRETTRRFLPQDPFSRLVSQWPPKAPVSRGGGGDAGGDSDPGATSTLGTSFMGATATSSGFSPPDTAMAVGPTQILQVVNGRITVYSKTGVIGALDSSTDVFFNTVRGSFATLRPRVKFDRLSNRWFVTMTNFAPTSNRVLVAVSSGPTITGAASFTFFQFSFDTFGGGGAADTNLFFTNPSLGVDEDALYIGGNVGNLTQGTCFVIRKSSILGAGPIVGTAFRQVYGLAEGPESPQGVSNDLAGTNEGYFIGTSSTTLGRLIVRRIANPASATPTMGPNVSLTVPATTNPIFLTTPLSTAPINTLDDRLIEANIKRNRYDNSISLWTSHHIQVDATGAANNAGNRNGVRWYEIRDFATTPTLQQAGTVFDSAATPLSYWLSGINATGQGYMALAPNAANSTTRPRITTTGRFYTDPLGQVDTPFTVVQNSAAVAFGPFSNPEQWGETTTISVDPTDDQTIWAAQQYVNSTNNWAIRIFELKAPPPTITSISPNVIGQGSTINITLTGTNLYDTEPGFAERLVASVGGSGVTVNSITLNSMTQATLNVTASGGAATGLRSLKVGNPDGQSMTVNNILTVAVPNPVPVVLSTSPSSVNIGTSGVILTITGSNFLPNSVARWNGSDRATTYISPTTLQATILASDLTVAGSQSVTVFNPAPGGGTSNAVPFSVNNPGPIVTAVSPATVAAGGSAFTLTVTGGNFYFASVVRWNGSDRPTTFVNASTLTASISAADIAAGGIAPVTVFNPPVGGGLSGAVNVTINNPSPTLTSISPDSRTAGGASFTLTCTGSNFNSQSVIRWNGSDRATTFVNSTTLTATISAADIATAGTFPVTVFNPTPGGGVTSAQNILVNNPVPIIDAAFPSLVYAGEPSFTLTVIGSNFVSGSVVRWNGLDRATTFVNSSALTATILASDIATTGTRQIRVFNPSPGGGTSAPYPIAVENPSPEIFSLSPSSKTAGESAFTLTVNGSGFNASSVVRWNGSDRPTTFVSSIKLTISISASDIETAGSNTVTVRNPFPGGGTSGNATLTVNNPSPVLSYTTPSTVIAGGYDFTLTVSGSNFNSQSVVRWNGQNRPTTFIDSGTLTATINASDIVSAGSASVTVFNPLPGGGTSGSYTVSIENPWPSLSWASPNLVAAGGPGVTITLSGWGYNNQSVARWNGSDRTTTFISSSTLQVYIPPTDISTPNTTASMTVFNPGPGGGTSGPITITIGYPLPILISISPTSVGIGSPGFTLSVSGGSFYPASVVRWNGNPLATIFHNNNSLSAIIPGSLLTTSGPKTITVFNPGPGGGSSGSRTLTVLPRVFSGTVNLLGYADPTDVPITLRFRPVGGAPGTEVLTTTVILSATGTFSVNTDLPPGNYDIYADGSIWLQRRLANVNALGLNITGLTWNLPAGDIDGDGAITPSDYGIWAVNNGSFVTPGESGDLDGDGAVTPSDYGIWAENNGLFDDD